MHEHAACRKTGTMRTRTTIRSLASALGTLTLGLSLTVSILGPVRADAEIGAQTGIAFERLTLEDGLSQSHVLAIWQDADGAMWFGTENGLNRFDGDSFAHYLRERGNAQALASDFIYDIAETRDGGLWLATNGGGLARLDRATGVVANYTSRGAGLSSDLLHTLIVDASGHIWLGTRGAGVDRFDPVSGEVRNYRFGGGAADEVFALWEGSDHSVWAGTNAGLFRLDPAGGAAAAIRFAGDDRTPVSETPRIRALLGDSSGHLWIGTDGNGLVKFDPATGAVLRFSDDALPDGRIRTLFEDAKRRVWVGTAGGLAIYDRTAGTFAQFRHDSADASSLGGDVVTSIFQDREGVLWVGTQNQGLNRVVPNLAASENSPAGTSAAGPARPNVTSFLEVGGELWIGTFGRGVLVTGRDRGVVRRYRHDPEDTNTIADDRVMSLLQDRAGRIWIGTMKGGISRLDPATGRMDHLRHDPEDPTSLGADGVMTLFEDSFGRIWVGTFGGGVSLHDPLAGGPDQFVRYLPDESDPHSLASGRVTAFAETADGDMWIGTDAGGLNLYDRDTGRFHRFRHDPADPRSLSADTVYSLDIDSGGVLWVGTNGGGLDRLVGDAADPDSIGFHNLSRLDGLANDVIYGIQIDGSGQLWLSTNQGISRFDPYAGMITNFGLDDGLQSIEFNFGAHYQSDSGELFFGGPNGFNSFRPGASGADGLLAPTSCRLLPVRPFSYPLDCAAGWSLVQLIVTRTVFARDLS